MVGRDVATMKKDDPNYERWYARHRIVETARVQRQRAMKDPLIVLEDNDRGELPETYSLEEMYWHPAECQCGSCVSPMKSAIKMVHADTKPRPRTIRALNPVPPLPHQLLHRLQAVAEEVLSRADSQPSLQQEQE